MKKLLFTTLALLAFSYFSAPSVFAQTEPPCGNVYGPIPTKYIWSDTPIVEQPITDCDDTFTLTTEYPSPYTLKINQTIVPDGGTIAVPEGKTRDYKVTGDSILSDFRPILYKHDGQDLRYVEIQPAEFTDADLETYVDSYFSTPEERDLYRTIVRSNNKDQYFFDDNGENIVDETSGDFVENRYYDFQYASERIHYEIFPEISEGTYTILLVEYLLTVNQLPWYKKFANLIIPTAHAITPQTDYPEYRFAIDFTIITEEEEPQGASSVLFLPGIQASRLFKEGLAGTEDEIWVPDGNQDVRQLAMDSSGVSQNDIYTKSIMADLPFGGTVYDSFARSMVNLVNDEVIQSWTPFAYDWRYSVNDIALNGTKYENDIRDAIDEIEYLADHSYTDKVTIIGHSNGGLLAKVIVKRLEQEGKVNLVDRVVLLASPQLGTPKAVGTILHGYDQEKLGGWAIDDVVARDVIQNMPGAYGLVTSQSYFNNSTDKVIKFENSTTTEVFRNAYGTSIDSEEELRRFMIGATDNRVQASTIDEVLRVNPVMLNNELNLHNTVLDNWVAPAGIQVFEIVGTGLDTVTGFEYRSFRERTCSVLGTLFCENKDFYKPVPLISQNGDKTVMVQSAEGYEGAKEKYYIDLNAVEDGGGNEEHYNISENISIQKLIKNILQATTTDIEYISSTNDYADTNRVLLGSHSPVDIEVITQDGKRVGKTVINSVPGKEENIPGSTYFEIGSSKYVIVPADGKYNVKLKGTSEGGLTFSLDRLNGNVQIPEVSVRVATITSSTSIKFTYSNNLVSNLEIDTNGDSVVDTILTNQGVDITPRITYKTLKDKINSFSLSPVRKLPLLLLVEAAEVLDKKSLVNPKLVQVEIFTLNQLEALAVSYQKKKWITQANLDELKFIIGKLK